MHETLTGKYKSYDIIISLYEKKIQHDNRHDNVALLNEQEEKERKKLSKCTRENVRVKIAKRKEKKKKNLVKRCERVIAYSHVEDEMSNNFSAQVSGLI